MTVIMAAVVIGLAVAGLSIGRILTGRSRLRRGCGYTPKRSRDKNEEGSCSICGEKRECEDERKH
jgi:hypothetical protein